MLRNKFTTLDNPHGEPDPATLQILEEASSAVRLRELSEHPIVGQFDYDHMKAIHRHLFQDVYEWAGQERGLSQEVLAGLVGRTPDWLGKIENNRIELDRLSVIKSLADVLDVALGDLLAEPSLLDWTADSGMETVPALRSALMEYRGITSLGNADSGDAPPALAGLRREVSELWDAYQGSRFGFVTGRLPARLRHAQSAADELDGQDQDHARRLLGLSYQLAATQLTKLGETDLAWIGPRQRCRDGPRLPQRG